MSVTAIKKAIKQLPAKQKAKLAPWAIKELKPETLESKVKCAIAAGKFNRLAAQALKDYADGKCRKRLLI